MSIFPAKALLEKAVYCDVIKMNSNIILLENYLIVIMLVLFQNKHFFGDFMKNIYFNLFFCACFLTFSFVHTANSKCCSDILTSSSLSSSSSDEERLAEVFFEESGRCTIIAQEGSDCSSLSLSTTNSQRLSRLGRIEIAWLIQAGKQPKATITHLEVDDSQRGKGIGQNLFQGAVNFLVSYLEKPEITWKAQPLDKITTLVRLIKFYEAQGGVVTREEAGIALMCLKENFFDEQENFHIPMISTSVPLVSKNISSLIKIDTYNIVKTTINTANKKKKTTVFTNKNY